MERLRGITFIGLSDILGTGISALFWFFLATLILPTEYGNIFYFLSIAGLISSVAPLATQNVVTVFSAKNINIQPTLFFISIILTGIGSIVAFLLFQRLDIAILIFGYATFNLASGMMLGMKKIKKYALTNIIQKILTPILGLSFYFIFGLDFIIFGLSLTYILHIIIILKEIRINLNQLKEIRVRFRFIIFNYANNISGVFGGQIDKLIIASLFGLSILGNYSLSMQIIVAMMTIPTIIFKYLLTEELYGIKDKEFKKKIIIFCSIISIVGFFLAPEIIPKIFPEYFEASHAIRIMSLAILPVAYTKIQTVRFLSQERGHIIFGGSTIYFIVLLTGMIFLGEQWGISGIALSFVLAPTSQLFTHVILNKKLR